VGLERLGVRLQARLLDRQLMRAWIHVQRFFLRRLGHLAAVEQDGGAGDVARHRQLRHLPAQDLHRPLRVLARGRRRLVGLGEEPLEGVQGGCLLAQALVHDAEVVEDAGAGHQAIGRLELRQRAPQILGVDQLGPALEVSAGLGLPGGVRLGGLGRAGDAREHQDRQQHGAAQWAGGDHGSLSSKSHARRGRPGQPRICRLAGDMVASQATIRATPGGRPCGRRSAASRHGCRDRR
jgi:hypothetical protein